MEARYQLRHSPDAGTYSTLGEGCCLTLDVGHAEKRWGMPCVIDMPHRDGRYRLLASLLRGVLCGDWQLKKRAE